MAVLIESLNVIINDNAFNKNPSCRDLFLQNIPSQAFCSDGLIYRIGFMDPKYVGQYIDYLEKEIGLIFLDNQNNAKDIVVIDMLNGPTINCDWIGFKRGKIFVGREEFIKYQEDFSIAWRVDCIDGHIENYLHFKPENSNSTTHFSEKGIAFPYDWTPDRAIYTSDFSPNPKDDLEEISRDEKIITLKRKSTGELVYVGIPNIKKKFALLNSNNVEKEKKITDSNEFKNNFWLKFKNNFWLKFKKLLGKKYS